MYRGDRSLDRPWVGLVDNPGLAVQLAQGERVGAGLVHLALECLGVLSPIAVLKVAQLSRRGQQDRALRFVQALQVRHPGVRRVHVLAAHPELLEPEDGRKRAARVDDADQELLRRLATHSLAFSQITRDPERDAQHLAEVVRGPLGNEWNTLDYLVFHWGLDADRRRLLTNLYLELFQESGAMVLVETCRLLLEYPELDGEDLVAYLHLCRLVYGPGAPLQGSPNASQVPDTSRPVPASVWIQLAIPDACVLAEDPLERYPFMENWDDIQRLLLRAHRSIPSLQVLRLRLARRTADPVARAREQWDLATAEEGRPRPEAVRALRDQLHEHGSRLQLAGALQVGEKEARPLPVLRGLAALVTTSEQRVRIQYFTDHLQAARGLAALTLAVYAPALGCLADCKLTVLDPVDDCVALEFDNRDALQLDPTSDYLLACLVAIAHGGHAAQDMMTAGVAVLLRGPPSRRPGPAVVQIEEQLLAQNGTSLLDTLASTLQCAFETLDQFTFLARQMGILPWVAAGQRQLLAARIAAWQAALQRITPGPDEQPAPEAAQVLFRHRVL